jgi:hypothetical protein
MTWGVLERANAAKPGASMAEIEALLEGRYDNTAQVARDKAEHPPPQHVTILIEPTPEADWALWRVHMDVEPQIAEAAGSDVSLDAVWAFQITQSARGVELIPYTLKPSLDTSAIQASSFDKSQWLSLAACGLSVEARRSRIVAMASPDEMCVAATMGMGGKRAFLPTWVSREGDVLQVQLIYFGKPWKVDAHRLR